MKRTVLIFIISLMACQQLAAQEIKTYRVGIFAPVYLDSVFNNGNYRYSKNFPKFVLPGLDFFQGAQIALDSMKITGAKVRASFYDSKSTSLSISDLISMKKLDTLDLIIGSVKDMDYQELAAFALKKNIPFISATYPNDGGMKANPFLVIVNSTLNAHCESIYTYLLQNHGTDNLLYLRKPGSQEDRVQEYFKESNTPDGKPLLNLKTISVTQLDFSSLEKHLDSTKENIIVAGSLDESFSLALMSSAAAYNEKYDIKLIGMPNWDNFAFSSKNKNPDFPVYFTSPYFNIKYEGFHKTVKDAYLQKYKGNPTDMSFKGFESVQVFVNLLLKHPHDFISHLNDAPVKVFSSYNFKPVFLTKPSISPDYFENKHLYFIRVQGKKASIAW